MLAGRLLPAVMDSSKLEVSDTALTAYASIAGTRVLADLCAWAAPIGFDPAWQPLGVPIVRDVDRRRVHYADFGGEPPDFIRPCFVQLEAGPPPWPASVLALIAMR